MSSAFEGLPKTPNLKLNKPGYDNVADIEALNENADILDEEIQGIKNTFVKSVNGKEPDAGGNVNVEEYKHPTTSGNKHIPSGGSSGQILRWSADGTATWGADNNTTYSIATQSANGLMSASDKKKLDGINASVSSRAYITETYVNGYAWYRKYSDGWIEQGGKATSDHITFTTAFSNTDYFVTGTVTGSQFCGSMGDDWKSTKKTTGCVLGIRATVNSSLPTFWYACGK